MKENIQNLPFRIWVFPLANEIQAHQLLCQCCLWLIKIPLYMDYIFFVHLSADGPLSGSVFCEWCNNKCGYVSISQTWWLRTTEYMPRICVVVPVTGFDFLLSPAVSKASPLPTSLPPFAVLGFPDGRHFNGWNGISRQFWIMFFY